MAKIKHIPTNEVHILKDSKTTACGFDITRNPECWKSIGDNAKTTCSKNVLVKPMFLSIGFYYL